MKLHEKLFKLRKENGMTQDDLAEKLDISRQAISRWEMGTALPDVINILHLSKLYGVSTDYLLNDE
jgi:transcriptional regulator with XRE-family HTH domain